MARILVVYGTGEGQTAKVADRIVTTLTQDGHAAEAVNVEDLGTGVDLAAYDAVLVGASIHVGQHQPAIREFLVANAEALEARPTGFFQVSLSAALDDEAARAEADGDVEDLLTATGFTPDHIGVFGGALRYSEYGFLKRSLMKRIAKSTTGDTDTGRDYEYTDWEAVERFAESVGAALGTRTPEGTADETATSS